MSLFKIMNNWIKYVLTVVIFTLLSVERTVFRPYQHASRATRKETSVYKKYNYDNHRCDLLTRVALERNR
jgi:hypothetical protein